jgi:hypothetical protein
MKEPTIIIEDDELPEAFRRPVLRKNKSKPPRPMSESVDYNPDLVEKLEGPALQRVLSLGPGERFKRSSIRLVAVTLLLDKVNRKRSLNRIENLASAMCVIWINRNNPRVDRVTTNNQTLRCLCLSSILLKTKIFHHKIYAIIFCLKLFQTEEILHGRDVENELAAYFVKI